MTVKYVTPAVKVAGQKIYCQASTAVYNEAMKESSAEPARASRTERLARFGRNLNALGALAIGGAAVLIPGPNVLLASWATLNAAQAGGFELWRQSAQRKARQNQKSRSRA